jgi:hypothetical protein
VRDAIERQKEEIAQLRIAYEQRVLGASSDPAAHLSSNFMRSLAAGVGKDLMDVRWIAQVAKLEAKATRAEKEARAWRETAHKAESSGSGRAREEILRLQTMSAEKDAAIVRRDAELRELRQAVQQRDEAVAALQADLERARERAAAASAAAKAANAAASAAAAALAETRRTAEAQITAAAANAAATAISVASVQTVSTESQSERTGSPARAAGVIVGAPAAATATTCASCQQRLQAQDGPVGTMQEDAASSFALSAMVGHHHQHNSSSAGSSSAGSSSSTSVHSAVARIASAGPAGGSGSPRVPEPIPRRTVGTQFPSTQPHMPRLAASAVPDPAPGAGGPSRVTGAPRRFALEPWSCPVDAEEGLATALIREHAPNPKDETPVVASILIHCIWQLQPGHGQGNGARPLTPSSLVIRESLLVRASRALHELVTHYDHTRNSMIYWLSNISLLHHFARVHQCQLPAEHAAVRELRSGMSRFYFMFFTSIKQELVGFLAKAFASDGAKKPTGMSGPSSSSSSSSSSNSSSSSQQQQQQQHQQQQHQQQHQHQQQGSRPHTVHDVSEMLANAQHLLTRHSITESIIEIFFLEVFEWICGCVFNALMSSPDMSEPRPARSLLANLAHLRAFASRAGQENALVSSRSWRRVSQAAALLAIAPELVAQRPVVVAEVAPELTGAQVKTLFTYRRLPPGLVARAGATVSGHGGPDAAVVLVELNPPTAFAGPRVEGLGQVACEQFDCHLAGGHTMISADLKAKLGCVDMPSEPPTSV